MLVSKGTWRCLETCQSLDSDAVQSVLEFAITQSSRSPVDFVPHQQLLWILEGMKLKATDVIVSFEDINHEMWFRWHQALWRTSSNDHGLNSEEWTLTRGPSRLFQAAQSVLLSNRLGHVAVPVKEYREKLLQLRLVIRHLWNFQTSTSPDTHKLDLGNLSALFQQILLAHKKSFVPHDYNEMRKVLKALHEQTTKPQMEVEFGELLSELGSILRRSQHRGLLSITDSLVIPCAKLLYLTSWSKLDASESLLEHGRLWLFVGSIRLRLLLPSDARDPVSKYTYKLAHSQHQLHNLNLKIEVLHKSEVYLRGSGRTPDVKALLSRTDELMQDITNLGLKIIHRPDASKFKDFCKEVQRFMDLSAGTGRIFGLWSKFAAKDSDSSSDVGRCRPEVLALQDNYDRFIHRLGQDFPAYRDFVQPVQQAVFELKFGLSLGLAVYLQRETMKSVGFQSDDLNISNLISALLEFPKPRSLRSGSANEKSTLVGIGSSYVLVNNVTEQIVSWAALKHNILPAPGEVAVMHTKVKILRIALLRIGHEILQSGITSREMLERLEVCFRAFSFLWQEIHEHRLERERRETQLSQFSTRTCNMEVEENLDEDLFQKMFPDYMSHFDDFSESQLGRAEEDDRRSEKAVQALPNGDDSYVEKAWAQMEEDLMKDVIHIHSLLFSSHLEGYIPMDVLDEHIVHTFVLSYDTGKQILQNLGHCIPASVDERLLPSHLLRYSLEYHKLAGGSDGYISTSNKFTDTNASEVATLLDPIVKYLHRVEELLKEWPDHPILLQLSQLSKTLLSFSLDTVVKKALTGVELLLNKSQLWEENAAKHVSIAVELSGLSRLVTRWRKLELEGWNALLEKIEEKHISSANKLWFSLYGLLNRPVGDDLRAHLEATTSSMEEFMQTATLGEFRARLQLVQAFYGHISQMVFKTPIGDLSRDVLEGISSLLYNLLKYYSQFLTTLDEILSSDKVVIEKELKDFVRLSKWDDRSYYTLSLSSEKTHRKLHKFVKKYDELLKRSVSELLTKQASRMGSQTLSSIYSQPKSNDISSSLHLDAPDDENLSSKRLHKTGSKKKSEVKVVWLSAEDWRSRCDTKLRQLAVVAAEVPEDLTQAGVYQKRLPVLTAKISRSLGLSLFAEANSSLRHEGADSLEGLATSVIVRSAELREGGKGLALKKKAMADLLKVMRQFGLSHHKSAVPKEQRSTQSWLLLHPAEVGSKLYYPRGVDVVAEQIEALDAKLDESCRSLWNKSSDYYFKNMALVQLLQRLSLDYHKDLSLREVDLAKRYMEHLLYIQQCQRLKAHELGVQLGQLGQLKNILSSCGRGLPRQKLLRKWLWQQKTLIDSLMQVGTETLLLIKTSETTQVRHENNTMLEADAIRAFVEKLLAGLQTCKVRLDNHLVPRNNSVLENKETFPILCTSAMYEDVSMNFVFLTGTEAAYKNLFQAQKFTDGINKHVGVQPLEQLLFEGYAMVQEFGKEIHSISTAENSSTSNELPVEFSNLTEKAILELLLAVQTISRQEIGSSAMELTQDGQSATNEAAGVLTTIEDMEISILKRNVTLSLDRVNQALIQLLGVSANLVDQPRSDGTDFLSSLGKLLDCIHVPLDMLHVAGVHLLFNYISLHKSVTKLGYILANLFVSLFTEGFCRTKEEADGNDVFEDDVKGTGMGEGEGKKDVSEQIEDEEQLMGESEQDKDVQGEDGGKKLDKGVEMEQDFSGDMEDLSDDVSEDDDDVEEDEKLDSRMGEDGEDNEIVDEKLWNDDDESGREQEGKEKYEKDSGVTGGKPEDLEMRGKEGADEEDSGRGEKAEEHLKSESEMKSEVDSQMESEEDDEASNREDTLEDSSGVKPALDEALELPDNLELDGEENGEDGDSEPEDMKDADNGPKDVGSDLNVPEAMDINDDMPGEDPLGLEDRDQNEADAGNEEGCEEESSAVETEAEREPPTGDANDEEPNLTEKNNDAKRPVHDEPNDELQEPSLEDAKTPDNTDARTSSKLSELNNVIPGTKGNSSQVRGEENILEAGRTEPSREDKTDSRMEELSLATADGADRTAFKSEPSPTSAPQNPDKPDINPYRSLGDALKQWKERIKVADSDEQSGKVEEQPVASEDEAPDRDESAGEYEFTGKEDDPSVLQALGPATKDQLDDIIAQSDDTEKKMSDDVIQQPELETISEQRDEEPRRLEDNQIVAKKNKSILSHVKQEITDRSDAHLEDEIERSIGRLGLEDESKFTKTSEDSQVSLEAQRVASRILPSASSEESCSEEEISRIRKELEVGLRDSGGNIEAARVIWHKYENLTSRLSQELAEQLRLILEPTLATKLEGDYRSGKRINMKKIIPYIASQFRKDKIWLRRTKANKRQYQVVLAIDDSRSMSESHCGHMALEALITICRAMAQVEIGQMAVASFGEKGNVHLLHDFNHTFSSEAGVNMVSRFSFSQDNTIADEPMVDLLHFLTRMLDVAARNATAPSENLNLQQLVLIIADGRFHEKETLRRCVREATSRKQLLAFIVLDNPQESILDLQSVSFSNGAPSFTKYLDSFPFPYYILLRDIESLPRTLADLLRQWFELTQRSYG